LEDDKLKTALQFKKAFGKSGKRNEIFIVHIQGHITSQIQLPFLYYAVCGLGDYLE